MLVGVRRPGLRVAEDVGVERLACMRMSFTEKGVTLGAALRLRRGGKVGPDAAAGHFGHGSRRRLFIRSGSPNVSRKR